MLFPIVGTVRVGYLPSNSRNACGCEAPAAGACPDDQRIARIHVTEHPSPTDAAAAQSELTALAEKRQTIESRSGICSLFRLLVFGVFAGGFFLGGTVPHPALTVSLPAFLVFLGLFLYHGRLLACREALDMRRLLIEEREARRRSRRRLDHSPPPLSASTTLGRGESVCGDDPESYPIDPQTADDLGLIDGPRNVFAFLDRTSTAFGSARLRHLLLNPLRRADDIRARQDAVRELSRGQERRDAILQQLLPLRRLRLEPVAELLGKAPEFAGRWGLFVWANVVGSVAPISLIGAIVTAEAYWIAGVVLGVALNLTAIGYNVRRSNETRDHLLLTAPLADSVLALHEVFASKGWAAPRLERIHQRLTASEPGARRFRRWVRLLGFHSYGVIFEFVNILLLWELRVLPLAANALARHRGDIEEGAGSLAEVEALICLSLPLAEHDEFTLPQVLDGERPEIAATELRHLLLPAGETVPNDLSLGRRSSETAGQGDNRHGDELIWILTGSNMSGKSTFLKAVGTNVAVAGAGGPVSAVDFRWTPLSIHSDINVRDSLDDGKSYFQVEVERVRSFLHAADEHPMRLVLFDELLRGTNTVERVAIARAVVRYLRDRGVLALVATHDRKLTEMVTEDAESQLRNRHLRETVKEGTLHFDYRLRDGAATTRNAIRVLEAQEFPESVVREAQEYAGDEP